MNLTLFFQLLEASSPDPHRASAAGPCWGTVPRPQDFLTVAPSYYQTPNKTSTRRLCPSSYGKSLPQRQSFPRTWKGDGEGPVFLELNVGNHTPN